LVVMRDRVRPWTNKGHVAHQHVQQLRQLVDAGSAKKASDARYPTIISFGLTNVGTVFQYGHGTKLVDGELSAVETPATLLEDQRPWRLQLDCYGRHYKYWQEEDAAGGRQSQIEAPLDR